MSESDRQSIPSLARELQEAIRRLLSPASSDTDWCSQESLDGIQRQEESVLGLVRTLRDLGGEEAERVLTECGPRSLVGVLRDRTRPPDERQRARYALIGLQDESTVEPLFDALSDPGASAEAFGAFAELRSPKAQALLPLARVLAGLESHSIDGCLQAAKHAAMLGDRRTVPSLVHALEYWVPRVDPQGTPPRADAKGQLQLRITIRRILGTLRSLGGEEAERAVQQYGGVLD